MPAEPSATPSANANKLTDTQILTTGAALGGGIGAALALESGTVTGAALVGVNAAYFGGLGASYLVGREIGQFIGSIPAVQNGLQSAVEYFFPTDPPPPQAPEELPYAPYEYYGLLETTYPDLSSTLTLLPLGG